MTEGFVLGVDLGTSHTVAMLGRPDGRTRPLLFDGRPLLPSAVYLDTSGRLHVGPDALRLGQADPARLEPHPKRHVDEGTVLLGDAEVPVADLLAAILGAVAREAVATAGFLPPAVLTYPASWGTPRREVLVEALDKAGWPRATRLLPEPVAAASYFADVLRRPVPAGSSLAVFDFGGGTLDVAVARNEGPGPDGRPRFTVLASGGDDNLGGLDLDAALVDHLGKTLSGGEPAAWRALTGPATLAQWRARREFWDSVRGAKEMLSRSSFAPIPVPAVEQAIHLTRDELEAAADPLVRRAVAETRAVIAAAGVAPADLAGLFLVGGSSRVPLVARFLHSDLGIAPTAIEQPEFPVAEGATLVSWPDASPAGTGPAVTGPAGASPAGTSGAGTSGADYAAGRPAGSAGQIGAARPEALGAPGVARFAPGLAKAATPTPTPATVPEVVPPITDTRADRGPITPAMPDGAPRSPALGPRPSAASPAPASGPWPEAASPARASGARASASEPAAGPGAWGPASGAAAGPGARGPASGPAAGPGGRRPQPGAAAGPGARGAQSGAGAIPGARGPEEDDRVYAEPVDPWATGEAAAIAAGGHGLYPGSASSFAGAAGEQAGAPGAAGNAGVGGPPVGGGSGWVGGPGDADGRGLGRKPRALFEVLHGGARRKAYLLGAGALAIVLVVGGVLAWHFRPRYPALDFQTLSVVRHVSAPVVMSSSFSDAEVIGERIYFASSEEGSGRVGVVAIDEKAGKPAWRSLEAGTAERWESMTALPEGVALLSASDVTGNRQLVVLGASDGRQRWQRVIDNNDDVYFVGDMAVLADNTGQQLIGLRLDNGTKAWNRPYPTTDLGSSTKVVVATTPDDLDGPATVGGRPLSPDADDDTRIVLISADRSARVIDAETGVVRTSTQGVAGTDDEVVAYDGRLIARQSEGTQRLVSYQLDKLGEPKVLYTARADHNHLTHLTPCGDRVCFVEDADYDAKTAEVTAVGLDQGGRVWHSALPGVDGLVPVGPDLLATTSSQTTLLDNSGAKVWSNGGDAARLDGGNLLEFAKPLTSSTSADPSTAGQHLGDQPRQLGPLTDVTGDTCSWNTSVIACVAEKDFVLLRFAK